MSLNVTRDGLPVVTPETYLRVMTTYPIARVHNSQESRDRIIKENPQLNRLADIGKKWLQPGKLKYTLRWVSN